MSLRKEIQLLQKWPGPRLSGRVTHVIGLLIESTGPQVSVGEVCLVYTKMKTAIPCQVVGFKDHKVLLMSLGEMGGIAPGAEVYPTEQVAQVAVSDGLAGRVLDALGKPIDGKGPIDRETYYPLTAAPPML